MGLLLLPIPITLIPIQATCRERLWRGVRELRWVPPRGALGAVIGAIAIGTAATSTSTTTIISIRTTISTAMSAARDKVIGSTIRNTAEMLRMETGKQPISLADVAPVVRVALVVPEGPAVRVALEVLEGELDQVAVVLVRDHLRARLALPVKAKSVTTAHRPDLVLLLAAEEDLAAAAAETTREPVAAGAAIAWAAAE